MSNPAEPTEEQINAIKDVLFMFSKGYELISTKDDKWVIVATLDLFTPTFFDSLTEKLGNPNNYSFMISRDEITRLRTTLIIQFYNF
jgi:hypothetical protein